MAEAALDCVLPVPLNTFWACVPCFREVAVGVRHVSRPRPVFFFPGMPREVVESGQAFKVGDIVVPGVFVNVVDMVPVGDGAVVVLPYFAMQAFDSVADMLRARPVVAAV